MSETFAFIVGNDKKRINVHSEAISRLSPSLKMLITGSMSEQHTKTVEWDDIEVEDFIRFCQFAYSGDYSPPEPELEHCDERTEHVGNSENLVGISQSNTVVAHKVTIETLADDEDRFHWGSSSSKKKKKKIVTDPWGEEPPESEISKLAKLRKSFQSGTYGNDLIWGTTKIQVATNSDPRQNFTTVFLSHAQLYVIGDKYDIEDLSSLALYRLHKTLSVFSLYDNRIEDVLQLVRYAYQNTRQEDRLRGLVTKYITTEVDTIGKSPAFHSLLEEGGEFVGDFWRLTQLHLL